jgi:hypothetical protein
MLADTGPRSRHQGRLCEFTHVLTLLTLIASVNALGNVICNKTQPYHVTTHIATVLMRYSRQSLSCQA